MADDTWEPRWRRRGYIPHFDGGSIPQSITFRLADSLPAWRLQALDEELARLPKDTISRERRKHLDAYLDQGVGSCRLSDPRIALLVQNALLKFDGERYHLHAWVIMPNHVHALLTPIHPVLVGRIVHTWKSYTATAANRRLQLTGSFWQVDYFDRAIRDERHFQAARAYIEANPTNAGMCSRDEEWPWGSAAHGAATAAMAEGTVSTE
ncbi:MAG: transposase [Chloroflexota bacterium]